MTKFPFSTLNNFLLLQPPSLFWTLVTYLITLFLCHRLTAVEEELLELARTLGSQQTSVEQLEFELEAEREGVKKGQRWADLKHKPESIMLWCCI